MCSSRGRSFRIGEGALGQREAMVELVLLFLVTGLSQDQ